MTSQGFSLAGDDIIFDNNNNIIKSDKPALLKDLELNEIYFENFEYSTKDNLFKSFRNTKVIDSKKNTYKFSQVYIDENKKEIVGSDVKAYLNEKGFKTFEDNKPRVFSNTVSIKNNETLFRKIILLYVITEKMISVRRGGYSQKRCFTTKKKDHLL